jgi:hypothetical protein
MNRCHRVMVFCAFIFVSTLSFGFQTLDKWGNGMYLDVTIKGNIAYCAKAAGGMETVDISNPDNPRRLAELPLGGGAADKIKVFGNLAVVRLKNTLSLALVDLTAPEFPVRIGTISYKRFSLNDVFLDFDVFGHYLAACSWDQLVIFDITQPAAPRICFRTFDSEFQGSSGSSYFFSLCFDTQGTLYVASEMNLVSVSLASPSSPEILSTLDINGWAPYYDFYNYGTTAGMVFSSDTLYLKGTELLAIDVTNPSEMKNLDTTGHYIDDYSITLYNNRLFLYSLRKNKIDVYDFSDPASPSQQREILTDHNIYGMDISDDFVVIAYASYGLQVLSTTQFLSKSNGQKSFNSPQTTRHHYSEINSQTRRCVDRVGIPSHYTHAQLTGVTSTRVSKDSKDGVGTLEGTGSFNHIVGTGKLIVALEGSHLLHLFQETDHKLIHLSVYYSYEPLADTAVQNNFVYAIYLAMDTSLKYGVKIISFQNVDDPELVAQIPVDSYFSDLSLTKILVRGNWCLVFGSNGTSVYTLNIANPKLPELVSETSFDIDGTLFRSITWSGNYIFRVGEYFEVFDVTDPTAVQRVFKGPSPGLGMPPSQMQTIDIEGNRAYVAARTHHLTYDISDPLNPTLINKIPIPGNVTDQILIGSKWICCTLDKSPDEMVLLDISSPDHPVLRSSFPLDLPATCAASLESGSLLFGTGTGGSLILADSIPTLNLPHVATTWGWQTSLVLDNLSDSNDTISLQYSDPSSGIAYNSELTALPHKQVAFDLNQMDACKIFIDGSETRARASYFQTVEKGIAEFELDGRCSRILDLNLPHYLHEHLSWMGYALYNPNPEKARVIMIALDENGSELGASSFMLNGHEHRAEVLNQNFNGFEMGKASRIRIAASNPLCGLTISGAGNSQLLFTKATTDAPKPTTRNLPHIADAFEYWDNYLTLDNTHQDTATATLELYSSGVMVLEQDFEISANSSRTINLNEYSALKPDSGELVNCSGFLNARLAYMYKQTGGTAEFLLDDCSGKHLVYDFPAYASDSLSWMGLAIYNPAGGGEATVTLQAVRNGVVVSQTSIQLPAKGKYSGLLEDIFGNNVGTVDRVLATASMPVCGLNISGANQDRYLFTPAIVAGD